MTTEHDDETGTEREQVVALIAAREKELGSFFCGMPAEALVETLEREGWRAVVDGGNGAPFIADEYPGLRANVVEGRADERPLMLVERESPEHDGRSLSSLVVGLICPALAAEALERYGTAR